MNSAVVTDIDTRPALPPASPAEIGAARFYEEQLVPALFQPYAPRLVAAARVAEGDRVLDVACGTGVVTCAVAERTGPQSLPVGLDVAPGMLAVAREANPEIDWRHGDAQALPFADASFDKVVCQFGLMFFAEPVKALEEMLRVLKPGGRIALATWNSISRNPGSAIMHSVLQRLAGARAAEALSLPYSLGDREHLVGLATAAGIGEIEIEAQAGEAHFPQLQVIIDAEIRGWLPIMGVNLDEPLIEAIEAECQQQFRNFIDAADGALRSPTSVHFLCGQRNV